jgi:DHA2 family multidrug resistance protein
MCSLFLAGRLVTRMDQRLLLGFGFFLNATALSMMSNVSLTADYWTLALPRLLQGFGMGFVFVPMQTLALATMNLDMLPHAAAAFNVVRNLGGSAGIALATTLLSRRSQHHQTTLVGHVDVWNVDTADRLRRWTEHFWNQGTDHVTAGQRALAMVYRDTQAQAQALAYADAFHLLSLVFLLVLAVLPFMHRVRADPTRRKASAAAKTESWSAASYE